MKALTLIPILLCLLLAACNQDPGPAGNSEHLKFETVMVATDTCVRDIDTQLLWQVHATEVGLNDAANTYTWFDPNEANGELDYRGIEDGGSCSGSACDTWHYVQAVNEAGYCGYHDWRMPNKDELFSISDIRRAKTPPTTDTDFFPTTQNAEYWTANDYNFQYDAAWAWNFELGHDRVDWKKEAKYVRLVRGTAGVLEAVKE